MLLLVLVVLDEEDLVVVDDEAAKARAYVSEMLLAWVDLAGWRKCRNMKCLVVGRCKKNEWAMAGNTRASLWTQESCSGWIKCAGGVVVVVVVLVFELQ